MGKPRIELKKLGKKFDLNLSRREGALFRCLNLFSTPQNNNQFWALRHINFSPLPGRVTGIIGRNGSGKSTLLRVIAGIYELDEGERLVNGEVVYLAGFDQGLLPKLSMRENIYFIGSLLGLSTKEVDKKFDEIVDFSGLADYVDAKPYQFSSGMINRLSFATTIHCVKHKDPEIILIDEALEAGADIEFQQKASAKIEELLTGEATVILVSHNLERLRKFCQRVIWLEDGIIKQRGPAAEVIDAYIAHSKIEKNV